MRIRTATALLCGGMLAMAACGGSGGGAKTTGSGDGLPAATVTDAAVIKGIAKDPAAAALVPASWRSKGALQVATSASYPPDEFIASDNKTIVGWDPDLATAIGKVLGLNFHLVNVEFDQIIPGITAHRYDLAMSSAGVEPDREKVIDFVTDFQAGLAFMVKTSSQVRPESLAALCGLSVAVEKGSVEQAAIDKQAPGCASAGQKQPTILVYPDQNAVNLALSSNRAQVAFADSPVVDYEVRISHGTFVHSGPVIQAGPEGIEIAKGNDGMRKALQAAMNKIISDGAYQRILGSWGMTKEVITTSQLEPAPGSGA